MRRALVLAALGLACAACSFPDVDYGPGADEAGLSDATRGDASVPDARTDGALPGDGATEDAAPDPCDFDRDGYKAADAGTCSAKIDAGDLDCDDNEKRRNPGVTAFLTDPTTNGDWNCNKTVEKQFPINVNCGAILGQAACNVAIGFAGDPACGASASYVTCVWNLIAIPPLCSVATTISQPQGCK